MTKKYGYDPPVHMDGRSKNLFQVTLVYTQLTPHDVTSFVSLYFMLILMVSFSSRGGHGVPGISVEIF